MKQKRCFKCGVTQPLTNFYRHAAMGDGHLNKCVECTKRDVRARYAMTRVARSAYEKERSKRPERRAKQYEYAKLRRAREPVKSRAYSLVWLARRTGRIVPRPCSVCGAEKAQMHHEDYEKPLDVTWLCFACHCSEHGKVAINV